MWHGAFLARAKKFLPLKQFISNGKKVSKRIDEHGIMHHLKEYQRRKVASDKNSKA